MRQNTNDDDDDNDVVENRIHFCLVLLFGYCLKLHYPQVFLKHVSDDQRLIDRPVRLRASISLTVRNAISASENAVFGVVIIVVVIVVIAH